MLLQSEAFRAMPVDQQREIAKHTVDIATYLAAPDGIKGNHLPTARAQSQAPASKTTPNDRYAVGLDEMSGPGIPTSSSSSGRRQGNDPSKFVAQSAREGAAVAGALLREVNFPEFVSGLINGVFHSIVKSSIQQMEAYGQLVKSVAQSLNQFRDENVSVNQGRDHLVDSNPDLFEITMDTGDFGEGGGPRVTLKDGVDEDAALKRLNEGREKPISSLDDETIEGELVPQARTELATSRQQLLATMVLMGINRIIVTDGKIAAKVMYDFRAQDNFKYRMSATNYDYDPTAVKRTAEGQRESNYQGGESTSSYNKDQGYQSQNRDASYYSKGTYKTTAEPVMTMMSVEASMTDAALQTRANLAGSVEVNFKSETFPLERMADSFQIGMIQNASQPRSKQGARGVGGSSAAPAANGVSATPSTTVPPTP
ncbi:MAG: hypothetical protein KF716_32370 [Anaerolineae bacterium]|nr:hypothetical protein [Anaerolineae bacterium]